MTINPVTRKFVRQRANYLCEYCHSSKEGSTTRFTIDHGKPRSLAGSDDVENLILTCHRYNMQRYNFTTGIDPKTGSVVLLFNPRVMSWFEHFSWSMDKLRVVGLTAVGRATCQRLDINDNGPGIPEPIETRIFDPFFTTKSIGKGTGLGLSISYQIVTEKHQGKMWCDSVPGEGTQFIVELPLRQSRSRIALESAWTQYSSRNSVG